MYSVHIRKKILSIKEKEKLSFVSIGKRFGMSPNTIYRWTKRIEPKIKREKRSIKIDMEALKDDVRENPTLYQYERAAKFGVSQRSIGYALKRLGVSYKKNTKASESRRRKAYVIPKEN